ncbi:glycine cleavage system H protein, partial [Phenoliferia sp. Uapishka_3]
MISAFRPAIRVLSQSARTVPSRTFTRTLVSKRYTIDHEWISFDDATSIGTMGITDYAQKALGDVVYVELPTVSTHVAAGEQMGAVESVKAASDIFAPVSGQVTEINETLGDSPGLLNQSAEIEGWLAKIHLSHPGEFELLLSEKAYEVHCKGGAESS